jgi:hypothetical protein
VGGEERKERGAGRHAALRRRRDEVVQAARRALEVRARLGLVLLQLRRELPLEVRVELRAQLVALGRQRDDEGLAAVEVVQVLAAVEAAEVALQRRGGVVPDGRRARRVARVEKLPRAPPREVAAVHALQLARKVAAVRRRWRGGGGAVSLRRRWRCAAQHCAVPRALAQAHDDDDDDYARAPPRSSPALTRAPPSACARASRARRAARARRCCTRARTRCPPPPARAQRTNAGGGAGVSVSERAEASERASSGPWRSGGEASGCGFARRLTSAERSARTNSSRSSFTSTKSPGKGVAIPRAKEGRGKGLRFC